MFEEIWWFSLEATPAEQVLHIPAGATILSAGLVPGSLETGEPQNRQLWYQQVSQRQLEAIGTEHITPFRPITPATCSGLRLWARVDPRSPRERCRIRIVGTGQPVDIEGFKFVSTVVEDDGVTYHVFARQETD